MRIVFIFSQQKVETFFISEISTQTCIKPKKYMMLTHLDIIVFLLIFCQSRVIDVSGYRNRRCEKQYIGFLSQ